MHTSQANMSAGQSQQFCVRWNSHLGSLGAAFPQLLAGQRFVDVTLACEGHQVHCHRLVLAACSTYFENLLGENPCQHPIIILPRDIRLWAIQALVDFMYKGEVNVSQAGLPDLMKCAEILKIRGLCGSDALNLNQIHSPTGSFQQQQQHQQHHQNQQHNSGSCDATDTNASTKSSDRSRQTGGYFQNQVEQTTRSNPNSGPKGQLLSSLHLQPVVTRSHQQDEGNNSDNGESGNEICIKTEDLIIDEDTNSKPCEDFTEREDLVGSDKMATDAIRCEQLLSVHAGMDVEDAMDDQDRRVVNEQEDEEERVTMITENQLLMERLEGQQSSDQHHQADYDNYADASEEDEDNDDVMEVREEAEESPVMKDGAIEKDVSRKRRRRSNSHSQNNNEMSVVKMTTLPSTSSSTDCSGAKEEGSMLPIAISSGSNIQRTNGARSIQEVPSLTEMRSSGSSPRGSIRVKSIENLFANYQTKQSPKSSREKRRAALLVGSSDGNNSENECARRNETEICMTPQRLSKRPVPALDPESSANGSASSMADGDGYENIICSPNFPQLTGVIGAYKAEDEDEDEEYGDEYAIQLLAEEIDSNMLANGADSEGDEILYKPPSLMAMDDKDSAMNVKTNSVRPYGRGAMGSGAATLSIRKIGRQPSGHGSASQSNSLARTTRRPRLMPHAKDGALHQLGKSNGAPPPIAFTLRNPRGNQPRTYNTEALWAALMDVKRGESIYRASQLHKVPRKTLRNWMKRWDIKSAYPMPRQLKEAAEKKRIIKELTSQMQ